jgi:hypothetical protein
LTGRGHIKRLEETVDVIGEISSKAADQKPTSENDGDELLRRLAQLRDDVSSGRVEEARAAVQNLEARWPESERVQYWSRVLAPPAARTLPRPDPRSRPLDRERAWLREHAREYPGCWLAVYEDRLIAADPDLEVVLAAASQTPEGEHALLYQQPARPQVK